MKKQSSNGTSEKQPGKLKRSSLTITSRKHSVPGKSKRSPQKTPLIGSETISKPSKEKLVCYCTDMPSPLVISVCEKRGWKCVSPEAKWNVYWSSTFTVQNIFNVKTGFRMLDNQIINHFPNYFELTKKDLMVRNIWRYRKQLEREISPLAEKDESGKFVHLDFLPATFVLPADYRMFVQEFRKYKSSTWIMKPCAKSQGVGIFLIDKLSQLKKWDRESLCYNPETAKNPYVISRYIENPLLIKGRKFDLRIYVLVSSFKPLKAYFYKLGFCRMTSLKYAEKGKDLKNKLIHLTNVSIQRKSECYNKSHGGKFPIKNLHLYIEGTKGKEIVDRLFDEIKEIVTHSLKAVANVMDSDRHCFECYGYDILVDSDYKPWLIEINASPALGPTTEKDRKLKENLIDDVLNICLEKGKYPNARWNKSPHPSLLGNFEVLEDEEPTKATSQKVCVKAKDPYNELEATPKEKQTLWKI